MNREEYNRLFHTHQLNLVAFKMLNDCDEEVLKLVNAAIEQEREACAKVCEGLLERPSGYQGSWEGYGKFKTQMTGQECAAAIRARGETK